MASDLDVLRSALEPRNLPVCAALTPFEVVAADAEDGFVRVEFAPQPAFGRCTAEGRVLRAGRS